MEAKPPATKTSIGLEQNVAGALCYVLGWITGIVFLVVEKENRFVRFHAMQSIVTFLPLTVLAIFLGFIPFIGALLGVVLWLGSFVLWLILMIQAFSGRQYKLPIAGDIAEAQLR